MTDLPMPRDLPEIEDSGTSNPAPHRPIGELIAERYGRRAALAAGMAAALAAATAEAQQAPAPRAHDVGNAPDAGPSTLTYPELRHRYSQRDSVAEGYEIQTLVRWGDPLFNDSPAFDPLKQSAESQAKQFGYNCDYVDFLPSTPGAAPREADRGVLWVNHEYTNTNLMFPGLGAGREARQRVTAEMVRVELMAHGGSFVEIRRVNGRWQTVKGARLNRRITAETEMRIAGPAAGHERMKTGYDPTGTRVRGMLNNCGGGNTPWGTILTCEENFNFLFSGASADTSPQAEHYKRYGITKDGLYPWGRFIDRFNLDKEPNEPNRFGYVVEIDPYDPTSMPVKRTALGRLKHEACTHALAADGRVVLYTGDDERFEFVYRFVTAGKFDPANRAANRDLLDQGTLSVARFEADGTVRWLPLVQGQGPLTAENGFHNQGDVVLNARQAATLLGATPMDRPEDVETNPKTGRVYVVMTNNGNRTAQQVDAANPRARNQHGHIIEIIPAGNDHAAETGRWSLFVAAGKPGVDAGTQYHRATSENGWLSCPDNIAFDRKGRIWIATDGAPGAAGIADGLYGADTEGPGRALPKLFYQAPVGAEVCGPLLTWDDKTLFLAIQHPGEERGSTFENPATRWPDFQPGMPPRPSVVAIVKKDGGVIGG
jgi:secreted PhoX family phosphatase